ncbi:MAG: membrane protein insertion efficiency factor YidD [Minisyncoccia bacterium]
MKSFILKIIRLYQKTLSPDHGFLNMGAMRCRFYPSCSEYTYQAIEKFGVAKGVLLGGWRILRCNPWFDGGTDLI